MREVVILRVSKGRLQGAEFSFERKESVLVGRQGDCGIRLSDATVSRYHCELDIDPPHIRVRELGSMNGTCLNGVPIGIQRAKAPTSMRESIRMISVAGQGFVEMKDGDYLSVGNECEIMVYVPHSSNFPNLIDGYRVREFLGQGAFGQVWLATHEADDAEYALKLMDRGGMLNDQDRLRFLRGATLASELDHPHIVRQYASGESDGSCYIVCELCEGSNVDELMKRNGEPLSVEIASHIILQVLDALDYAHHVEYKHAGGKISIGLVHRDIKPNNILLMDTSEKPLAKIGDFGLSKLHEITGATNISTIVNPSGSGDYAGLPDFTPSIQIRYYKRAKPEVDVWAAAATYYYMLTGFPPKDLSYAEKWELALIEKAIPIRKRNDKIPERLAEVIDAALVEEPTIGCQSAYELKRRIESVL